jgi:hypothetical protein
VNQPEGFTGRQVYDHRPLSDPEPDRAANSGTRRVNQSDPGKVALPARGRAVLGVLLTWHWLTTRQIQRLVFDDAHRSSLANTRAAHRTISRLYERGLIDRLNRRIGGTRSGSAAFIWRPTPAGARVFDPFGERRARRSRTPGLQHLAHALDVAEVAVRLYERARQEPSIEVTAVETEPACWRRYTTAGGRAAWLKPDLRLTLRVPARELHWFIELDRATEHRPTLQRKIGLYLAAWCDGGEETRAGVFPRVAWIVPHEQRADEVTQLFTRTPGLPEGLFAVTTPSSAIDALIEPPQEQ